MIGKSLNYAYPTVYADGGPVLAVPPRDVQLQFTPEQQQQMDEANARRIAAEASSAKSKAESAAIRAANPNIDFSDEGYAAALADAEAYLASKEGIAAAAYTPTYTPTSPYTPAESVPYTPVEYDTEYSSMPEISIEDALGDNAGQDAYQAHVQQMQMQPAVMPPAQNFYTPPEQLGLGSFMPDIIAQQQQAGYLMSSVPPQNVFNRTYVTNNEGDN